MRVFTPAVLYNFKRGFRVDFKGTVSLESGLGYGQGHGQAIMCSITVSVRGREMLYFHESPHKDRSVNMCLFDRTIVAQFFSSQLGPVPKLNKFFAAWYLQWVWFQGQAVVL